MKQLGKKYITSLEKRREYNQRYYAKHKNKFEQKYGKTKKPLNCKYVIGLNGTIYEYPRKQDILDKIKRVKIVQYVQFIHDIYTMYL